MGVGALVLLLGACGGDDDSEGADEEFCEQAMDFMVEGEVFDDPSTNEAAAALDEAESFDPPEEIADDWQILIDGARALADIDPDDPEAEQDLPAAVENMGAASTNVFGYLSEDCGIDLSEDVPTSG